MEHLWILPKLQNWRGWNCATFGGSRYYNLSSNIFGIWSVMLSTKFLLKNDKSYKVHFQECAAAHYPPNAEKGAPAGQEFSLVILICWHRMTTQFLFWMKPNKARIIYLFMVVSVSLLFIDSFFSKYHVAVWFHQSLTWGCSHYIVVAKNTGTLALFSNNSPFLLENCWD